MSNVLLKIEETKKYLEQHIKEMPTIGLILGSGLGVLADEIENPIKIKYEDIPNFPVSTVVGHAGQFVVGDLEGKKVIAMQGRFHYYEGYTQQEVTFPVRIMKALGVENLVVTNAAGGVNTSFVAGDLMLITDHINFSGDNPLYGKNIEELGPRFPDMSEVYNKEINSKVVEFAKGINLALKEGVYFFNSGPAYETPAEVKMARLLGGDAVGMSTVPEAIVANHMSMKITGISCITNMAAGILQQPLHHGEVVETADRVRNDFINLVKGVVGVI